MKLFRSLWLADGDAPGGGAAVADAPPPAAAPAPAAAAPAAVERGTGQQILRSTLDALRERVGPDDQVIGDANAPTPLPPLEQAALDAATPAAEAPAADAPPADAPVADAPFEPIKLVLPAIREGQEPLEIVADDPEAAAEMRDASERISHILRNGRRTDELNRQMENVNKQRAELDYVQDMIKLDPVGFVASTLPPATKTELALSLLAEDGVLDAVQPVLEAWINDPKQRQIDGYQAKEARTKQQEKAKQQYQQRVAERNAVSRIVQTVDSVTSLVDPSLQNRFADDLLRDVQDASSRDPRVANATPEQLIGLLTNRFQLYGVKPENALAALKQPNTPGLPVARPKGEVAERIDATAAAARTTGARFRSASTARRTAAAVPSPDAGGSPPAVTVPAGQNVKERLSWLKRTLAGQ